MLRLSLLALLLAGCSLRGNAEALYSELSRFEEQPKPVARYEQSHQVQKCDSEHIKGIAHNRSLSAYKKAKYALISVSSVCLLVGYAIYPESRAFLFTAIFFCLLAQVFNNEV